MTTAPGVARWPETQRLTQTTSRTRGCPGATIPPEDADAPPDAEAPDAAAGIAEEGQSQFVLEFTSNKPLHYHFTALPLDGAPTFTNYDVIDEQTA